MATTRKPGRAAITAPKPYSEAVFIEASNAPPIANAAGIPFSVDWQGGLFGFYFLPELPTDYAQVMKTDGKVFNKFFHGMLERGHYFAPALYEAGFVSAAHTEDDIDRTIEAAKEVFRTL